LVVEPNKKNTGGDRARVQFSVMEENCLFGNPSRKALGPTQDFI